MLAPKAAASAGHDGYLIVKLNAHERFSRWSYAAL
jgi:hypothetical protein